MTKKQREKQARLERQESERRRYLIALYREKAERAGVLEKWQKALANGVDPVHAFGWSSESQE